MSLLNSKLMERKFGLKGINGMKAIWDKFVVQEQKSINFNLFQ